MALNFPTNPTLGQIYIEGDRSFIWNGVSWLYKNEYLEIKTAIANAINNAGGSITTATPFHNYPAAIESLGGGGGGVVINGLIESYPVKEGETINAGDFVDYINGFNFNNNNVFSTADGSNVRGHSAVVLENNKIVITYGENNGEFFIGRAIVGTISGTSITWGNAVAYTTTGIQVTDVTALGTDKVVIAFEDGNTTTSRAIVGTISGTSISFGSASMFVNSNVYNNLNIITLGTNKIAISYTEASDSYRPKAIVGTISGTSITWGSPITFTTNFSYYVKIRALGTDKMIAMYDNVVRVATISGTTISLGTATNFTSGNPYEKDIDVVETDKVIIVFGDDFIFAGNSIIATISGTTITLGSVSVWRPFTSDLQKVYALGNNKVVATVIDFSTEEGNGALGMYIGTVSGTSIAWAGLTYYRENEFNGVPLLSLGNDQMLLYRSNYALIANFGKLITNTTAEKVFGLAKTGGTAGQTIEVYTNL
jgi:hypothetical protein